MTSEVNELVKTMREANRKGFFRQKPIFKQYATLSHNELRDLQIEIGVQLPHDLGNWLVELGYGDIDEKISFRKEWFTAIKSGQLTGGVLFAQDELGNFYAFDSSGRIYYLSRSQPVFAVMSNSFLEFMKELMRRDYELEDWVNTLETNSYAW